MQTIKKLVPRFAGNRRAPQSFTFQTAPLKRRFSNELQERAAFISEQLGKGATYQTAVREYDSRKKVKHG